MAGGGLAISGLRKAFGPVQVLDGVDLAVAPGQRHGLLGVNGAGKTTLFNLITGDLPVDAGRILLDGRDMTRASVQARVRAGLGRTYQMSSLAPSLTVRANLVLSLGDGRLPSLWQPWRRDGDAARVLEVAERFALRELLDQPVNVLSHGGHRQLELAMALLQRPRILLLDEPGAGLSPSERRILARVVRELPADVGLLMIEHDMDIILKLCEHITVLHQGRVLVRGTPAEVASNPVVREIYLGQAHA